jgi:hypothetical protein
LRDACTAAHATVNLNKNSLAAIVGCRMPDPTSVIDCGSTVGSRAVAGGQR